MRFNAMEETELAPMEMPMSPSRNVAVAYGKGAKLRTFQVDMIADMLILNCNPKLMPARMSAGSKSMLAHELYRATAAERRMFLPW